jgi:serine phosphatase RsbU (regulator of sigma subunit)
MCLQASQVGGDYYDFLDLGSERLGLIIGDISGKGIAAALLMANLQANLRGQSTLALEEPQRLLRSVNQLFYDNTSENDYATLFFAEFDNQTRALEVRQLRSPAWTSASRQWRPGAARGDRTLLGLFKEWDCAIEERILLPGDLLALYTDGVTESFDAAGQDSQNCV